MTFTSRRHRVTVLGLPAAVALLVSACQDSRLRALEVGMSKDSVLQIIAEGAPAGDSLPNLYKQAQYLIDGKLFDVYHFEPKGRKLWKDPDVTDDELIPIVVIDGKLEGTGWSFMDGMTDKYRLPGRTVAK